MTCITLLVVSTHAFLSIVVLVVAQCLYCTSANPVVSLWPRTSTQVTGAGQNLGRELAVQLSRLGAKLILLDINEVGGKKSFLLPALPPLKTPST